MDMWVERVFWLVMGLLVVLLVLTVLLLCTLTIKMLWVVL